MPQNPLGITGISNLQHSMPGDAKREICIILSFEGAVSFSPQISQMLDDEKDWDILEEHVDNVDAVREFLSSLDDSIGLYHAAKDVQEDSKATAVRKKFRAAHTAAKQLKGKLRKKLELRMLNLSQNLRK